MEEIIIDTLKDFGANDEQIEEFMKALKEKSKETNTDFDATNDDDFKLGD